MTPPIDLAAVRKLIEGAVDGPWTTAAQGDTTILRDAAGVAIADLLSDPDAPTETDHFIAESRTLVPAMADEIEALRRMLETATVRIEILVGRMRACKEHERSNSHELSILESGAWIEEQRDLLGRTTT